MARLERLLQQREVRSTSSAPQTEESLPVVPHGVETLLKQTLRGVVLTNFFVNTGNKRTNPSIDNYFSRGERGEGATHALINAPHGGDPEFWRRIMTEYAAPTGDWSKFLTLTMQNIKTNLVAKVKAGVQNAKVKSNSK